MFINFCNFKKIHFILHRLLHYCSNIELENVILRTSCDFSSIINKNITSFKQWTDLIFMIISK